MLTVHYDGEEYTIPDLPSEITKWLDFMCEHYPQVMRELLDHPIGALGTWFSTPVNEIPTRGCLVGSAALMMSKVMASTCAAQPSLVGIDHFPSHPRWSAAYYLTEFVSRCDPAFNLTEEEWGKLIALPNSLHPYESYPKYNNVDRLPAEKQEVARQVVELYVLTHDAGLLAAQYSEELFLLGYTILGDGNDEKLAGRVAIQAFKDYIKKRLEDGNVPANS